MQKTRVRVSALIMALGVALAFVLMGTNVKAADSYNFELTIDPEANINVSGAKTEVENCGLEYDVYKVADAEYQGPSGYDTYKYVNWKADFQPLQAEFEAIANNRDTVPSDWREFYKKMAELVATGTGKVTIQPTTYKYDPNNKKINLDEKGLYLIITHGNKDSMPDASYFDASAGYSGVAYSNHLRFTFEPTMIVAPTKYDDKDQMEGIIYTEGDGEWKDSAEIHLKSDRAPLFGDLIINKRVFNFTDEETTFAYSVVSAADDADDNTSHAYLNYAAITLRNNEQGIVDWNSNNASTKRNPNVAVNETPADGNVVVRHLPAGLKVNVHEIYDHKDSDDDKKCTGRYKLVLGQADSRYGDTNEYPRSVDEDFNGNEYATAVIKSDIQIFRDKDLKTAEVYFANEYNGNNVPGHGVHNEGLYEKGSFNSDGNNNHQTPNKSEK